MYKVLIVDDEPIVKIALKSIINWSDYGYEICDTASDGIDALDKVNSHKPDLVITDLKMPRMDGIELIKTLRENGFGGEILVISNYDDFDYVRTALVNGATDYILKVSIEAEPLIEILGKITANLNKKSGGSKEISEKKVSESNDYLNLIRNYLEMPGFPADMLEEKLARRSFFPCAVGFLSLNFSSNEYNNTDKTLLHDTVLESLSIFSQKELVIINPSLFLVAISNVDATLDLLGGFEKIHNALKLYLSLESDILIATDVNSLAELKDEYEKASKSLLLSFYRPLGITSTSSLVPLHYMDFIFYKDFAGEVQKNNNRDIEISKDRVDEIICQCKDMNIYPEITIKFFEKTLELLEFMNPTHTMETHEFLVDQKELLRSSENAEVLAAIVKTSFEAIFSPISGLNVNDINNIRQDIKDAVDFINKNYCEKLSLDDIAEKIGLSPAYLSRTFKAETGLNITGYINKLKMEKAASLIQTATSDTYMKEIAFAVGIEDQLYFSRLFKKYYDMSPSEYREKNHLISS